AERRRRRDGPARRRVARRRNRSEAPGGRRGGAGRCTRRDRTDGGGRVTETLAQHLLPTYARLDVTFVDGEGSWLVDADGKRYLDCLGGIAVVSLGHRHPAPPAAPHAPPHPPWHLSDPFWTAPMHALAGKPSDRFGGASAFYCNSGTEAIEAAIKWARKATGRSELVALENSFHGRTMGALSITGQPAKRAPFEPLVPGVRFARPSTLA